MFLRYTNILYNKIKKNQSMLTIDFFFFKLNLLKNKEKSKKILIINKFIKINIFFDFFYGKLQNNFNISF